MTIEDEGGTRRTVELTLPGRFHACAVGLDCTLYIGLCTGLSIGS